MGSSPISHDEAGEALQGNRVVAGEVAHIRPWGHEDRVDTHLGGQASHSGESGIHLLCRHVTHESSLGRAPQARLCQTSSVPSPSVAGPLLALDTASLYYRSYFALPSSMTAPDGRPHQAIRGFLSTVARLVGTYRPAALVAAWDTDWRPAWRVELVPSYKAHRVADVTDEAQGAERAEGAEGAPADLDEQAEAIGHLLDALGLPRWGMRDHEADDVLGSLTAQPALWPTGVQQCIVVSGDRDLVQLIDSGTRLLLTVNGGMDTWPLLDTEMATTRFGVAPDCYVDMATLRGDASDGLPGVPGIGPKTAVTLVNAFGSVESALRAAENAGTPPMTPRIAERLREHSVAVLRAKRVSTAVRDLGLPSVPLMPRQPADPDELERLAALWGVQRQVREVQVALGQDDAGSEGS
ncbi:MAG TPA: flap endonuclease [Actinobacteria bacterium]|nr:flap endonuclease [Actinomycetota bacterium]